MKKVAARRKVTFADRVEAATAEIEKQQRWLRENPAAAPAKIIWHRRALKIAHSQRRSTHKKLTYWRERWVWARNRDEFWEELLEARRRKLKAAQESRQIDHRDFEPWMTRGHEHHTLTQSAKAVIAIGTLQFGLWTSSTFRPETPASHHGRNPTPVGDMAGEWEDMTDYQRWLYLNHLPHILELYGPDNLLCADNGRPAPQSEGSFNENLHDTHDHIGFMSANYPLAYGGGR